MLRERERRKTLILIHVTDSNDRECGQVYCNRCNENVDLYKYKPTITLVVHIHHTLRRCPTLKICEPLTIIMNIGILIHLTSCAYEESLAFSISGVQG